MDDTPIQPPTRLTGDKHSQAKEIYVILAISNIYMYSTRFYKFIIDCGYSWYLMVYDTLGLSKEGWYIMKYLCTEVAVLLCGYITFVPAIQV